MVGEMQTFRLTIKQLVQIIEPIILLKKEILAGSHMDNIFFCFRFHAIVYFLFYFLEI